MPEIFPFEISCTLFLHSFYYRFSIVNVKYHSITRIITSYSLSWLQAIYPLDLFLENIPTSVELDKLQEIDEEISQALNYLGFRIFFKFSLHRSEYSL